MRPGPRPAASPDGPWLAYQSDEFRTERDLCPFFEWASGDSLFAARIDAQDDAAVQSVAALFPLRQSALRFDVFPGDSLFIVFDPPQAVGDRAQPVVVVHNFDAELEAGMGAGRKP